ncbi:MAG: hypothetical protein R3D70_05980 [Rhizobiaceae bacterium]
MTRFQFDWEKAIQAIDFIANLQPGLTQYYIGKVMFSLTANISSITVAR